jgi:hypothetical protein
MGLSGLSLGELYLHIYECRFSCKQDDTGVKVNILGGSSIGHCEEKVYMNIVCLIVRSG